MSNSLQYFDGGYVNNSLGGHNYAKKRFSLSPHSPHARDKDQIVAETSYVTVWWHP